MENLSRNTDTLRLLGKGSILSICSFFLTLNLFSQNSNYSIQLENYFNLSTSLPAPDNYGEEYFKGIETYSLSNSIILKGKYHIGEKMTVSLGIGTALYRDKSKEFPADPSRGFLFPIKFRSTLLSVEMPMEFQYKIGQNTSLLIGASIFYSFHNYIQYSGGVDSEGEEVYYNYTYIKDWSDNFDYSLNLGFEFLFSKFTISPFSQYHLRQPEKLNYGIFDLPNRRYFSLGFKVGYVFKR